VSSKPSVVIGAGNHGDAATIMSLLRHETLRTVVAADSEGVMDLAQTQTADLVLLDARRSDFDGLELCRRMRRDARLRMIPIVLISELDEVGRRVAALDAGADDFLSWPLEPSELVARVRSLLRLKSIRDSLEETTQVILALANAAEAKDRFTVQHAERVSRSACRLASRVGLDGGAIEQIRVGALIHDVGKIAVPDQVLNKPGPLTRTELELIKRHTVVGAEIVAPLSNRPELIAIVRNHHERFDGAGYPDGLIGERIPLSARIVAICDAHDAMVSVRPYRPAMSKHVALDELLAGAGSQWDRGLVADFVALARAAGR
jgi:putative two-component system response regulator